MRITLDTDRTAKEVHAELTTFCIVGFGRIGSTTARLLTLQGIKPVVFDGSEHGVSMARRMGLEAHLIDATSERGAARIASTCDVVSTALPSTVAEKAIPLLTRHGLGTIVDVSYVRDPMAFRKEALKHHVKVFVDMGLAPGLSNILAAHAASDLDRVTDIVMYVGGLSADPNVPLGLVASWSMVDLIEEYTRPARALVNGKMVTLNPIDDAKRVELPGLGVFDAMPTDGLRTLLETYSNVSNMVEYTVRYPGHVETLRILRRLGLLDSGSVGIRGCSLEPRELLAHLLEERLPKTKDRVILVVEVKGVKSSTIVKRSYILDEMLESEYAPTTLALLTSAIHSFATVIASEGFGHPGVVKPEELGMDDSVFGRLLSYLKTLGVSLKEVTIEEKWL